MPESFKSYALPRGRGRFSGTARLNLQSAFDHAVLEQIWLGREGRSAARRTRSSSRKGA